MAIHWSVFWSYAFAFALPFVIGMESCDLWLLESVFFQLARWLGGTSMLVFPFLLLSSIPLREWTTVHVWFLTVHFLFLHFPSERHLDCFQFRANTNKAALNIPMQVWMWTEVDVSFFSFFANGYPVVLAACWTDSAFSSELPFPVFEKSVDYICIGLFGVSYSIRFFCLSGLSVILQWLDCYCF